jgi:hypothetical protein
MPLWDVGHVVDFVVGSVKTPLPVEVKMLDTLDPKDKCLSGLALFVRRFPATRRALVVTRYRTGDHTLPWNIALGCSALAFFTGCRAGLNPRPSTTPNNGGGGLFYYEKCS